MVLPGGCYKVSRIGETQATWCSDLEGGKPIRSVRQREGNAADVLRKKAEPFRKAERLSPTAGSLLTRSKPEGLEGGGEYAETGD
jgi:hypothetical protein